MTRLLAGLAAVSLLLLSAAVLIATTLWRKLRKATGL